MKRFVPIDLGQDAGLVEDEVLLYSTGTSSSFWRCESGQDLVEYSLMLAFICLTGAALFIGMGQMTTSLWGIVNGRLAAASNNGS